MVEPNWGLIRSGATFESLVTSLLCFDDPSTVSLGRQGRDDGQDAKSADGTIIYQMKFHAEPTAAKAIRDAIAEAEKIAKYRNETGPRQEVWSTATDWVLATNASFNARDKKRWDDEVVPAFKAANLSARYLERADIEGLLHKHPELKRAYFEGETRVFLSLPEAREQVHAIDFHPEALAADLRGRTDELDQYQQFLDGRELVLVVHGPGGIGKTRLMLEGGDLLAAQNGWQVLWANLESLAASSSWYRSLVPERKTLILVDDPEDPDVLRALVEQASVATARAGSWKIVVAVRSPNDPVLNLLKSRALKRHTKELEVQAIDADAGTMFCRDLLDAGPLATKGDPWLREAASWIATHYEGFPAWIGIAANLLAQRGDLSSMPDTAADLASEYLDEIVSAQKDFNAEQVLAVVRWLALLRTLNTENQETLAAVAGLAGISDAGYLLRCLDRLVQRRVAFPRGARNRLLEIKPDVLTDHILREWLTAEFSFGSGGRQASSEAKAMVALLIEAVEAGPLTDIQKSALGALARLEFIQRHTGEPVDLIGDLLAAIETAAPNWGAGKQLSVLSVLETLIPVRIEDVARIATLLLASSPAPETEQTLFGDRTTTHTDVVLALPWMLFGGAMYAESDAEQSAILSLLCEIAMVEGRLADTLQHGLPNDGKRAGELVVRAIEGEASFRTDFHPTAIAEGRKLLEEIRNGNEPDGRAVLLPIIVAPLLAVERQRTDWNDHSVTLRRYAIVPGKPEWEMRAEFKQALEDILTERKASPSFNKAAWGLLAATHSSAHRAKGMFKDTDEGRKAAAAIRDDIKAGLEWALASVQLPDIEIDELKAARQVWDWQYRFGKDEELNELATKCEDVFRQDDLSAEFQAFTDWDDWERAREKAAEKGRELATSSSAEEISAFVARASRYLGGPDELHRISVVGNTLGREAAANVAVQEYVKVGLEGSVDGPQFRFAVGVAATWLEQERAVGGDVVGLLKRLLNLCAQPKKIIDLIWAAYSSAWHAPPSEAEARVVVDQLPHFISEQAVTAFLRIAGGLPYSGWGTFSSACETAMAALESSKRRDGFRSLLESLHLAIRKGDDEAKGQVNDRIAEWVLEQLLLLPDIDNIGGNAWWHLRDLLGRTKRPDLAWLLAAIQRRIDLEPDGDDGGKFKIVPTFERLTSLIDPIPADVEPDEGTRSQVAQLAAHIDRKDLLAYYLPQYVHDVDPHGLVLPELVVEKLTQSDIQEDFDAAYRWARFGGVYAENSDPWKKIARAALALAPRFDEREQISLMNALTDPRVQSYSGAVGEVPAYFTSAVETAKRFLEEETEDVFVPYRQWRLRCAEADLQREKDQLQEERGE